MATLYIREYKQLAREAFGGTGIAVQAGQEPAIKDQLPITIGASSVQSDPFQPDTAFVLVTADAIFSIKFGGADVAATANNLRFPANTSIYFGVTPGKNVRLAVITNS
jgi:acetyltransferase-like isoleucine patch superfamily enzyme